jgi:glucokinase
VNADGPGPGTHTPRVLLAADVGGTHARVGLVRARPDANLPVTLLAYRSYQCGEWSGLAPILEDFLARHCQGRHAIARGALAVAGYVRNDELVAENLRWPVRIRELRERLQIERVDVVNDFEALACATRYLGPDDRFTVIDAPGSRGPTVVVGPGTGLGCAVLTPEARGSAVLASEAGHAALAPGNEREIEVLRWLGRDRPYVHVSHVLSGPGLVNLYRALAAIDGIAARHSESIAISGAALDGSDPLAREALAMFCAMLGGFVGDLAITFKAGAGVCLAGGILPSIREFLLASDFRSRFFNKGLMRGFLASVPVRLIEHGKLGVIGAAAMDIADDARSDSRSRGAGT